MWAVQGELDSDGEEAESKLACALGDFGHSYILSQHQVLKPLPRLALPALACERSNFASTTAQRRHIACLGTGVLKRGVCLGRRAARASPPTAPPSSLQVSLPLSFALVSVRCVLTCLVSGVRVCRAEVEGGSVSSMASDVFSAGKLLGELLNLSSGFKELFSKEPRAMVRHLKSLFMRMSQVSPSLLLFPRPRPLLLFPRPRPRVHAAVSPGTPCERVTLSLSLCVCSDVCVCVSQETPGLRPNSTEACKQLEKLLHTLGDP